MSDARQLLEDAARAAGHTLRAVIEYEDKSSWYGLIASGDEYSEDFDPLNDDGDALRLAVRLNLLDEHAGFTYELATQMAAISDPYAATRLAIVRAAAAIGQQMREAECS